MLVEAAGEKAVVLEIANGGEQPGGYVSVCITQDGLEDLDLLRAGDLAIVRLVAVRVYVVGVADDGAVGIESARLEDDSPVAVLHDYVQPCPARWIGGRQLVPGQVLDVNVERELPGFLFGVLQCDARGLRLEKVDGAAGGGDQLLRAARRCADRRDNR